MTDFVDLSRRFRDLARAGPNEPGPEAAPALPWSTGPVEGKITKLKLVKWSMYGHGGIGLLRQRMLAA